MIGPFVREHFIPRSLIAKMFKQANAAQDGHLWNRIQRLQQVNIVTACKSCDERKGGMHPAKWVDQCPEPGKTRVRQKLREMGMGATELDFAGGTPRKSEPPRDGRSTSDGPGLWYGKPTQEELRFKQISIERWLGRPAVQPVAPPSWSEHYVPPMRGAQSLRTYAKRYMELKHKESA